MGRSLAIHVFRDHVGLGALVAGFLYWPLGAKGALVFWLAAVLVDLDHHWNFVWRSGLRDLFNIRKMFAFHGLIFGSRPGKDFLGIDPLHTLEFLLLLFFLKVLFPSWVLHSIFLGCVVHFLTDIVHQIRHGRTFVRAYSFIEYAIRRRRLVARGLSPDRPFEEALRRLG